MVDGPVSHEPDDNTGSVWTVVVKILYDILHLVDSTYTTLHDLVSILRLPGLAWPRLDVLDCPD